MKHPHRSVYQYDFALNSEQVPTGHLVYYADGEQEIIHANKYIVDLFECDSIEEFLDLVDGSCRNFVYEEDRQATDERVRTQIAQRGSMSQVYYRIKTKTGKLVTVLDFASRFVETGEQRPALQVFIIQVSSLSMTDWLTGLPNMARFHSLARAEAASLFARGDRPVAVSIDVMGMKDFNARYGRDEGDKLLFDLATVLRAHFGNNACSRFAEDRYYAFSAEKDVEDKLQAVFADFAKTSMVRVPPVRAGIYTLETNDDIVAIGFDRAKLACDLDRNTWQSHYTWFTDEMREAARRRIHVLEILEQALAKGWVQPYYQAIVRSSTGEICNEEALARWMDPQFGKLFPDQFIPDLEEAGLLYKLDLHIVDCVVRDLVTRRRHGVPLVPVSMNFSLRDLVQLDLASELSRRADDAGIPRDLLRVELTESVASSDPEFLREQLRNLHAAGFEVWMDDFGSGYSSLNTLQEFDFDLVKLDMGFLRSSEVEKSHIIMAGVIQAAGKLGVATLTEGVEAIDQAVFLESIGCDMLQGYHFSEPHSLGEILNHHAHYDDVVRERYDEKGYWDTVSLLSLSDLGPAEQDESLDWGPMREFPVGIIERRQDLWRVLRGNQPFYDLLDRQGLLAAGRSHLMANPVDRPVEPEVDVAANRSVASGSWERIAGHIEQGEGFQFFLRHVASTPEADSFQFAAMPTMLGTALGAYGDVPLAYAVFRVHMDADKTEVEDCEYVYANDLYHSWSGFPAGELSGKSFLETQENADPLWFPYCYRAVVGRERIHDVVYSPEIGHWLSFYLAPTPVENCCVYAFAMVDDEQRERAEMAVGRDTSDLIISFADLLNSGSSYHEIMGLFLEMLSGVIHAERLYVYERDRTSTSRTFEWCAPGVDSFTAAQQNVSLSQSDAWDKLLSRESISLIPSVDVLRGTDDALYDSLVRQGVQRILAVPLYHDGNLVGYVGADNYEFDEDLDTTRLLSSVAPFLSARIANHQLLSKLEHLGTHDELTNILNRRGVDLAIAARIAQAPDEPYALVLMDIDDFKILNDLNGYAVGDELLRRLSATIAEALPDEAVFGRNGGDEFVAMIQGEQVAHIESILARVQAADKTFECEGTTYATSLSIGYALCPEQTDNLRMAYSMADTALYAVKLAGKASFKRYESEMETQYRRNPGFTPADIAEHVPGSIVVHLPGDGKILFANNELIDLFECADLREFLQYTGGTFGGMIHPDDRDRVRDELAVQMSIDDIGCKDFVDFRILTKGGNVVHVADNGRLVELEGVGKVFYELLINREERGIR